MKYDLSYISLFTETILHYVNQKEETIFLLSVSAQ